MLYTVMERMIKHDSKWSLLSGDKLLELPPCESHKLFDESNHIDGMVQLQMGKVIQFCITALTYQWGAPTLATVRLQAFDYLNQTLDINQCLIISQTLVF